ncbi:MAG TPA: HAD family hydrolase [Candidatus Faecalibacterium avium]|uniref:HAD family hydrolase n=1 Tax=unclassified Faecalibacterium TaxID=2646395 RepID=UPI000B38326A|nr:MULTISPECIES: HAD family hydrolase [unclassified Faecalibacterium]OUN72721.1 HAD family hydrolase [Faecalibacterium sp. An58]OUQ36900.1 HAD family hydrolase [Faecalibacterium sp. An121]HIV42841.1 HAD family hydrolase [Candidatus Faecalibacterium avium]
MERDHIGLIASDMDYTLLDENGRLPQDFARLVLELEQEGVYFAAASGRPLYTLEDMFPDLRGHIALIGDNGGVIRWRGRDIFQSRMPGADYREMAAATREAGDIGVLCGLDTAYVERQYQQYARVFSQFYTRVAYVDDLTVLDVPADKYTIYLPRGDSQAAYDKHYGRLFGQRFSVAVAGPNWVDIMNRGVDKGAALRALGRSLGLTGANLMAFGDTYNDAEMLCTAKYGFLMTNGSQDLRARVAFLAPPHWDQGVVQIMRQVLDQGGWVSPGDFTPAH